MAAATPVGEAGYQNRAKEETSRPTPQAAAKLGEIATLAYLYWQERGCQAGFPGDDWDRAEADLYDLGYGGGMHVRTTD